MFFSSHSRYRNFRTFTSPQAVQFSCLSVDNSGEVVCAGSVDTFEIFVWCMKTGRLIEVHCILYLYSGKLIITSNNYFCLVEPFIRHTKTMRSKEHYSMYFTRGIARGILGCPCPPPPFVRYLVRKQQTNLVVWVA